MNRAAFFDAIRPAFGGSLTAKQVEGMEALLDECAAFGCDRAQAAYILATARGESGHKMQPTRENMNYSAKRIAQVFKSHRRQGMTPAQLARKPKLLASTVYGGPWGAANLGNRVGTDDGWTFRGWGISQVTGRANTKKWADRLGLPLLEKPALLNDLDVSVKALVRPMMEGWATGHSLPQYVKGAKVDYINARRTWNGTFDAAKYADYARQFEKALTVAGYAAQPAKEAQPAPSAPVLPSTPKGGLVAAILRLLASILKGRKA